MTNFATFATCTQLPWHLARVRLEDAQVAAEDGRGARARRRRRRAGGRADDLRLSPVSDGGIARAGGGIPRKY